MGKIADQLLHDGNIAIPKPIRQSLTDELKSGVTQRETNSLAGELLLKCHHKYLKCQVLIDLKVGKFSHQDAGQMNFYLNYFAENETAEGDNPPIGIILCTDKRSDLRARPIFLPAYEEKMKRYFSLNAWMLRT